MDIQFIIFIAISAVTIGSAAIVAFSRNIIYSAFALLGVFVGVLGLYIMLSADFVAIVQLVVYIGGILVLILFAVMLTTRIETATGRRKLLNRAMEPITAFIGVAVLGGLIWHALIPSFMGSDPFVGVPERRIFSPALAWWGPTPRGVGGISFAPTTAAIGNKLLQEYLLPFEIVSLLLVLVLVGAVVLARREVKQ